ncbi:MAG: hypothetical protein IJI10_08615 [Eubacterium sp.]|nr:hypothetical protein [Eubacterium sp.]
MYQEAIKKRFIEPLARKSKPYVGVELELPIVNRKRIPVQFDAVQAAAERFVQVFHFQNVKRDDNGHLWFAEDPVTGDSLSFDCSYNTLEWSFGRTFDIHTLEERFRKYYAFTQEELQKCGHMMTGMGINPHYLINRREPVANGRYRMLYQYLQSSQYAPEEFPLHAWPFFGMFSAASQVQMDVDQSQIIDVIEVFNLLEPVKGLLFANSVWPENPDILINRDWLWEYSMHGINPKNVGLWNEPVRTIEELTDYIADMNMFCTERNGKYLFLEPISWKNYITSDSVTGFYVEDAAAGSVIPGILRSGGSGVRTNTMYPVHDVYRDAAYYSHADGGRIRRMTFRPEEDDIQYLRSYKYVDLTYRGTIEFRSTCTQPIYETFTVAAFHAGLMQRLPELKQLLTNGCTLFQQGMSPKVLRTLLSRRSIPASLNRTYLRDLLMRVLDLARDGLYQRGFKEAAYLDPLYLRAEQLSNPAREIALGLEHGRTMESFVQAYGQLDKRLPHSTRQEFYRSSGIGLEEESLRVKPDGYLADTPHPVHDDPLVDRDFSEAQIEMITHVRTSPEKLYESILQKREKVVSVLNRLETGRELLWPHSVPPYLKGEEDIRVAQYTDDLSWKSQYRDYLAEKYGKRKMLLSGIHFNFSYPEYYLRERFEQSVETDFAHFTEKRYLELAEKSAAYSWLVAALTAASPVQDASYWREGAQGKQGIGGYSSLRTSEHGYWNQFVPVFDYSSIQAYINSIHKYVEEGMLREERELYYPIRVKPARMFSVEGFRDGISHIEYRMIDLNPLDPAGIDERDISFLVLLITWLEFQPPVHADRRQQEAFAANVMEASRAPLEDVVLQDLDGSRAPLIEMALRVIADMERMLGKHPAIEYQKEKLLNPEKRYAVILQKRYEKDFVARAMKDAEKQTNMILADLRTKSADGMYI